MTEKNSYKILITSRAKQEIKEIKKYYNIQLKGLGEKFLEDFKIVTDKIQINPFIFGFQYLHFRTAKLEKFPYKIHYYCNEVKNEIIIFTIAHPYRNHVIIEKENLQ